MDGESIRERIRSLERWEFAGLAALAVLIVAGAGLWYARSLPSRIRVETTVPAASRAAGGGAGPALRSAPSPTPSPRPVVVDVAGWVRRPGVYEFHQGDRVIDAIRRAGGARSGADLTSINLAAILTDAEQLVVGKSNGAPPVSAAGSGSSDGAGPAPPGGSTSGAGGLIDVNTATLDQLESLPGIGPALGQRIIDYRQEHGPFRSVDDLLNVSGIGDQRLSDIRSKVTV